MSAGPRPSKPKESHVPSVEGKLESRLNIKDLEALQEAFSQGEGPDEQFSLSKEQFVEALMLILCRGTKDEYGELFDKIDIANEKKVDWDKFASHMLLEFYEKDDRIKSTSLPQWKGLKTLHSPHKDAIQRILLIKNLGRYLTISKEGCVGLWGQDLKLQKTIKTGTDSCRQRDLWVTDFFPLNNVNKVALAFTSKEIAFYDMSAKLEFNCQIRLLGLEFTPLCLDYWFNPENPNEAIMVWGDSKGFVNVLFWTSASIALFERTTAPTADKEETTLNVTLNDIIKGKSKTVSFAQHQSHSDWVRQVRYLPSLECFVSCATNWDTAMVIAWLEKPSSVGLARKLGSESRLISRQSVFAVHQGVNTFDYHEGYNLIATGCVNYHVCLWNPYVVSKPNGLLRGHMAPVLAVQFNRNRGHLISFSKDKVLRIWDIQLQVCIQRLAGVFPKGQEVTTRMYFHEDRTRLFLTFNYGITMLEMKVEVKDRVLSHEKPIVSVVFNSLYNQIISACQGGTIYCWMVDTGQRVKSITQTHGDAELTCMAQDPSETRLYTGSTDGTVKIWDFNGHCHHTLICADGNPADIGQVLILKRCVIVMGFSRQLVVFKTSTFQDHLVHPSDWKGGPEHEDDVLAATFLPPHTLATGSYDGEIILWNLSSEMPTRRMAPPRRRTSQSTAPTIMERKASLRRRSSPHELQTERQLSRSNRVNPSSDQLEIIFTISRLIFLESRRHISSSNKTDANLVSCGGDGVVRFWNTNACTMLAEYTAHENASSIIMNTDTNNQYLATGDVDGLVKVWIIKDYCLNVLEDFVREPPVVNCQWLAHTDMISGLTFSARPDRLLLVTASSDCSVGLWDLHGNKIGVFGQEQRWRVDIALDQVISGDSDAGDEVASVTKSDVDDTTFEPDPLAIEDPKQYRVSAWQQTRLGKDYQEVRVRKRQRRQPTSLPDIPYIFWDKVGIPSYGPFYSLAITSFNRVNQVDQPDFMHNPDKYFLDKEDSRGGRKLPALAESQVSTDRALKAAFDERSLFPRYLIEFDHHMKRFNQYALEKTVSPVAGLKPALRPLINQFSPTAQLATAVSGAGQTRPGSASRRGPATGGAAPVPPISGTGFTAGPGGNKGPVPPPGGRLQPIHETAAARTASSPPPVASAVVQ